MSAAHMLSAYIDWIRVSVNYSYFSWYTLGIMDNNNAPFSQQEPLSNHTPSNPVGYQSSPNKQQPLPSKTKASKKTLYIIVSSVVIALAVYITYIATLAYTVSTLDKAYVVTGSNMSPTLKSGQKILVAQYNVLNTKLLNTSVSINDIVIANVTTQGKQQQLVERVIAVGGDRVFISNGALTVYDATHPKGFDPSTSYEPVGATTGGNVNIVVPSGDVYLLGDNRSDSLDSRSFGTVPITHIVGIDIGIISS